MIRRLRLRNFRAFTDLQSPEFAKTNVILGPNGAGKSSIRDAISLVLSGTATGCETGIGLSALKSVGSQAKRWQIDAQLGEHAISRTDDEGPRSAKQQLVESLTGVAGSKARACIESGELVRLDLKARQRLLLDLAPKATVVLPPAIRKAVHDLLGEDHAEVEVSAIERLHKAAYEARAEVQREVKSAGDLEAPTVPDGLDDVAVNLLNDELHEVKAQIVALRSERDAALSKAAPKTTDTRPLSLAIERTARELETAQHEIGRLPSKMEIGRRGAEIVAKIAGAGETNADLEVKRRELKEALGSAEGAMKTAKAALDTVKAQRGDVGTCPVCQSKITKLNRGKLEVSLTNKWEAAARERQRINEVLSVTAEPLSTATLQREADELTAKESRLVSLLADEKRLAARHLEEQAALAEAEAKPDVAGDTTAQQEAETLAVRIAKGEEIRDALVSYIASRKAYEERLASKASSMHRHAALDQLVNDLGPTGIRKGCGNAGMFAFHEDLNALLKPRGFVVDLRPAMDAEGDPIVTAKGKPLPLAMLSDGERIAFGAAFACAVASVTGLGIVCVDNFERLDPEAHGAVMEILTASPHQSFVFSVERDDGMEAIAAEVNAEGGALRMFLLREGQLVAPGVGEEAAA
jgi:DNA repair ATPase RecN